MCNYADDEGRRERLESAVREREKDAEKQEKQKKKEYSYKGREEDERTAKANRGRHIERVEGRTINVRTTTSRWLVDQTRQIDYCGRNLHRRTQFEIIKSFVSPQTEASICYISRMRKLSVIIIIIIKDHFRRENIYCKFVCDCSKIKINLKSGSSLMSSQLRDMCIMKKNMQSLLRKNKSVLN